MTTIKNPAAATVAVARSSPRSSGNGCGSGCWNGDRGRKAASGKKAGCKDNCLHAQTFALNYGYEMKIHRVELRGPLTFVAVPDSLAQDEDDGAGARPANRMHDASGNILYRVEATDGNGNWAVIDSVLPIRKANAIVECAMLDQQNARRIAL